MSQMRRVALAACTAAAMIVPTAGLAQGIGGRDIVGYLGGSVGQSMASDFCTDTAGASCDDKDTAWSIFIGHEFNRHVALELGYRDFGEMATGVPGTETSINAKAFELLAVGILPVGDRFSLYTKFGAYFGETDTLTNSPLGAVSTKDSNINLTYGVGAEWEFLKQLRLRVEWQRYQEMSSSDVDLDAVSIGLVYRFK
jgi:OmpA-OmpF porin, OOP family